MQAEFDKLNQINCTNKLNQSIELQTLQGWNRALRSARPNFFPYCSWLEVTGISSCFYVPSAIKHFYDIYFLIIVLIVLFLNVSVRHMRVGNSPSSCNPSFPEVPASLCLWWPLRLLRRHHSPLPSMSLLSPPQLHHQFQTSCPDIQGLLTLWGCLYRLPYFPCVSLPSSHSKFLGIPPSFSIFLEPSSFMLPLPYFPHHLSSFLSFLLSSP